jgi:hypothetical protein
MFTMYFLDDSFRPFGMQPALSGTPITNGKINQFEKCSFHDLKDNGEVLDNIVYAEVF